ncbi:acetoin dehydrogenase [Streptomyces pilosus]|uniref:SDR family NAD(P)-dependent oxidoreductase n=1 Tax=Streptomyces pilosus TaxID=28893 RepID=UPI0016743A7A|nr:SDR family oxidoreductase [Streptomyces pilosus]GGV70465.1 acetoin dehydrogenase [Streptomyces pilosus]
MAVPFNRFDFTAGTAIVTGAASGIGEQLAYLLARKGNDLALVDRDAARLEQVAEAVATATTVTVTTYVVDLADPGAARRLGEQLAAEHPDTRLLINNAGATLGGTFDDVSAEEFDWLLAVNLHSVVTLTRALLPILRSHPGSHLVNVSSVFGLVAPAGQVAYCTSKFAVRGFTEALRAELTGQVGVTVVHPGGVRTRIAENARVAATLDQGAQRTHDAAIARMLTYPPDRAAVKILESIAHRRPRTLIGMSARLPDLLSRLSPGFLTPRLLEAHRKHSTRRA